ncbi:MAG: phage integrase SAM-like domain-containing protein [Fimbriiglobus sp.]|nr:phage integrase SAM-like domain-containing protein [Fimbriiglobus sp.]
MASISTDSKGNIRILFVGADKKRRTIRLGKVSQKNAEAVKLRVEHLHNASVTGSPLDPGTARWMTDIGDDLAAKLAAVGLIPERPKAVTLAGLLALYESEKEAGNKPGTRTNHRTITNDLTKFFRPNTDPRAITEADAKRFVDHLRIRKLAPYTVSRRVRRARSIFAFAVKKGLVPANPFGDLKTPASLPEDRKAYVTRQAAVRGQSDVADHHRPLSVRRVAVPVGSVPPQVVRRELRHRPDDHPEREDRRADGEGVPGVPDLHRPPPAPRRRPRTRRAGNRVRRERPDGGQHPGEDGRAERQQRRQHPHRVCEAHPAGEAATLAAAVPHPAGERGHRPARTGHADERCDRVDGALGGGGAQALLPRAGSPVRVGHERRRTKRRTGGAESDADESGREGTGNDRGDGTPYREGISSPRVRSGLLQSG